MKPKELLSRHIPITHLVIGLATLTVAMSALFTWQPGLQAQNRPDFDQFYQSLRDGVGTEVHFAKPGASPAEIQSSVKAVAQFIALRSGEHLSEATKSRLVSMEDQYLQGTTNGIVAHNLTTILVDLALNRIGTMTDSEIGEMATTLCGFQSPGIPPKIDRISIKPRANTVTAMTKDEFIIKVKLLRDNALARDTIKPFLINTFQEIVDSRIQSLQIAVPELYPTGALETVRLSPVQSMLLVYCISADDSLAENSHGGLRAKMMSLHDGLARRVGFYPLPDGYFAYGQNGYLYSSPMFAFEPQTIGKVLDRLQ